MVVLRRWNRGWKRFLCCFELQWVIFICVVCEWLFVCKFVWLTMKRRIGIYMKWMGLFLCSEKRVFSEEERESNTYSWMDVGIWWEVAGFVLMVSKSKRWRRCLKVEPMINELCLFSPFYFKWGNVCVIFSWEGSVPIQGIVFFHSPNFFLLYEKRFLLLWVVCHLHCRERV